MLALSPPIPRESTREVYGERRSALLSGGDIKYIKSVDGVTWTSPKMIITQASDQGIPKLVANQLQVHAETGHWAGLSMHTSRICSTEGFT